MPRSPRRAGPGPSPCPTGDRLRLDGEQQRRVDHGHLGRQRHRQRRGGVQRGGESGRRPHGHHHRGGPDVHGDAGGRGRPLHLHDRAARCVDRRGGGHRDRRRVRRRRLRLDGEQQRRVDHGHRGASGTGNGAVAFSVAANPGSARTGTITVAGQTFTVTQAAAAVPCTYTIAPTDASIAAAGGTGTVAVSAAPAAPGRRAATPRGSRSPRAPAAPATAPWRSAWRRIRAAARTGTITVAGQTFTVTQARRGRPLHLHDRSAGCLDRRGGRDRDRRRDRGTGCAWTASSNAAWITVTSGASGTGNGVGGVQRGGESGQRPHRDHHRGGPDVHGDAGGRAVPCTYTIGPAGCLHRRAGRDRDRRRVHGRRLRVDGEQQRRMDHGHLGRKRHRQRGRGVQRRRESARHPHRDHHRGGRDVHGDAGARYASAFTRPRTNADRPSCTLLSRTPRPRALLLAACILLCSTAGPASAQQSVTDVLTFLLTNRSIPTGDFVRDEQAAVETRDILAQVSQSWSWRPFPSPRRRAGSRIAWIPRSGPSSDRATASVRSSPNGR